MPNPFLKPKPELSQISNLSDVQAYLNVELTVLAERLSKELRDIKAVVATQAIDKKKISLLDSQYELLGKILSQLVKNGNIKQQINVEAPKMPDINVPEVRVTIPDIVMPEIKMPEINVPKPIINVESPSVTVEAPDFSEIERLLTPLKELTDKFSELLPLLKEFGTLPDRQQTFLEELAQESNRNIANMGAVFSGGVNDVTLLAGNNNIGNVDVLTLPSIPTGTNSIGNVGIKAIDSPSVDAFGRWRSSDPITLFDSKQILDNQPLFWDEELQSGGGIASAYSANTASTVITSTINTAGVFTRQTFMRFNYQPGKSQLVMLTGILDRTGGGTGVERRVGLFDDNNGLFFEDDAGTIGVTRRTNVTGTPVDNTVTQANWNMDPMNGSGSSGVNIDWSKTQIFVIDFEWLGVGRVRMGMNVDGVTHYVHQFLNTNVLNKVYMSTPNLPLRYQMITTASSPASTMEAICSTVISEGGLQDTGIDRHTSTANTQVDCAVVGTIYAIKGIRLKSTHVGATIKVLKSVVQVQSASDDLEWLLIFNPTVAGSPSWSAETNSAIESSTGATANTVTNGIIITGGYLGTGAAASSSEQMDSEINNALRLGADISGNVDTIWLCGRSLNNVNVLVEGGISWKELS